jgi:hypothetical protein
MDDINYSSQCAPIVIHTYTRLEHLKKTVSALQSNDLAHLTDLFIASDAAREKADEPVVSLVRDYIESIRGFKSVTVIRREYNLGAHQNAALAFEEVFKVSDRLIAIEDDTIVGRGFLRYINDGLTLYSEEKSVFAICGYLYKSIRITSSSDAVLLPGFSAWGYGIWKDRFNSLPNYVDIASEFLRSPKLFMKLMLNRPDLIFGVWGVANRSLVAADLVFLLDMIKRNKKCLFPKNSLVRNIGNDGSGLNCVIDYSYDSQAYNHSQMLYIGSNTAAHRYPQNPFFSSLGGWRTLLKNLTKFLVLITFGERLYKKLSKLKSPTKQT